MPVIPAFRRKRRQEDLESEVILSYMGAQGHLGLHETDPHLPHTQNYQPQIGRELCQSTWWFQGTSDAKICGEETQDGAAVSKDVECASCWLPHCFGIFGLHAPTTATKNGSWVPCCKLCLLVFLVARFSAIQGSFCEVYLGPVF